MKLIYAIVNNDDSQLKSHITVYGSFLKRWNIDFADIPDYKDGLVTLIKKYGESFNSAVVDTHKEALG